MERNGYCPCYDNELIKKLTNNKSVVDFFCPQCNEEYELESRKQSIIGKTVPDGAYYTMLERIQLGTNPNFFSLAHKKADYSVQQLMLVPKHFITADMIVLHKKGAPNRPDYIMCSMNIASLPESSRILLIDRAKTIEPETVSKQWQANLFLRGRKVEKENRLLAIMKCIDKLPEKFTLAQVYEFKIQLSIQFPENNHIKDKIRQQPQILRDRNVIESVGWGIYRKVIISLQVNVIGCSRLPEPSGRLVSDDPVLCNEDAMKAQNDGKQMKYVWTFTSPDETGKTFDKHLTQKPLALLKRYTLAASNTGDLIFNPSIGSGITGVTVLKHGQKFCSCEQETEFFELVKKRLENDFRYCME